MSELPLKDICEISAGQPAPQDEQDFSDKGIPFVRAGSLEPLLSGKDESNLEKIDDVAAKKHRLRIYPKNTILFAKSGMSAKIGRVYRLKSPAYIVSHLAAVIPGNKIDPSYLQRWFEFNPPSKLIPNDSYPSIRTSEIERLKILLPSLSEQKRIAAILDKADAIRRKRTQTIHLLNEFQKSLFLDMFGDPVTNEKGWKIERLDKVASIGSGITKGKKYLNQETIEVPYIRVANVQAGYLDMSEIKTIHLPKNEIKKCSLMPRDILMTEGGDWDKLGRGAIWNYPLDPCVHQNHIFRVRCDESFILPEYLDNLLQTSYAKGFFQKASKQTSNLATINKTQLSSFPVPVPSLNKQNQFLQILNRTRMIIDQLNKEALGKNDLSQSLTHRAFKGEL